MVTKCKWGRRTKATLASRSGVMAAGAGEFSVSEFLCSPPAPESVVYLRAKDLAELANYSLGRVWEIDQAIAGHWE
jgi:hypothetical protein